MSSRGTLATVCAALIAATLGVYASVAWFGGAPALTGTPLGRWLLDRIDPPPAPSGRIAAFQLPTLAGPPMRLPLPGRAVLVNYWASWCEPCRREMPLLQAFARAQGAGEMQVVGIALDDPAEARAFLVHTPVDFPILLEVPGPADSSVRLGNGLGVLPYTVLIDAQGRMRGRRLGPFRDQADLEDFVATGR